MAALDADKRFPYAYFLTFTTYGTRLHGDLRGSVDRHSNVFGEPFLNPDPGLRRYESWRSVRTPFVLDPVARSAVADSITRTCELRGWHLLALNVRTNHVHAIVGGSNSPESILSSLKAHATREMREQGLLANGQPVWTRHGSTRYLWREEDIEPAWEYTVHGQDAPKTS